MARLLTWLAPTWRERGAEPFQTRVSSTTIEVDTT